MNYQRVLIDTVSLVGLAMIGVGLWLLSPAVSLVAVGVLLLVAGVVGAVRYQAGEEGESE